MAHFEKRQTKSGTKIRVTVRLTGFPAQRKTFTRMTDAKMWRSRLNLESEKVSLKMLLRSLKSISFRKL